MLFGEGKIFSAPTSPLDKLFDPTGAGDVFAGGFTGFLDGTKDFSFDNMKRGVIYGSVLASFCVSDFSTKAIENLDQETIEKRYEEFITLSKV